MAPAIRAILGLHTPQQIATCPATMSPSLVRTPRTRPPSTSMPRISVLPSTCSAPSSWARSRMIVPARSESTTPTLGKWRPPSSSPSSMKGTSFFTSAGVSSSASWSQAFAADSLRRNSCIRASVRATSMPPLSVNTPSALYCAVLSVVSSVIIFECSKGKMKFEACPVEPPGFGNGPLSTRTMRGTPRRARW